MIYVWPVVILVTFPVLMWATGRLMRHWPPPVPVERLADPAPLPGELPIAGYLPVDWFQGSADPGQYEFPDTGPLLIVSETTAAGVQLERDVAAMIADAEQRIPPRWRT